MANSDLVKPPPVDPSPRLPIDPSPGLPVDPSPGLPVDPSPIGRTRELPLARLRELSVDPRVVDMIQRCGDMRGEQGADFLAEFGGPTAYRKLAGLPLEERLIYVAVVEGQGTVSDIQARTGLESGEVNRGLEGLRKRGLVGTI